MCWTSLEEGFVSSVAVNLGYEDYSNCPENTFQLPAEFIAYMSNGLDEAVAGNYIGVSNTASLSNKVPEATVVFPFEPVKVEFQRQYCLVIVSQLTSNCNVVMKTASESQYSYCGQSSPTTASYVAKSSMNCAQEVNNNDPSPSTPKNCEFETYPNAYKLYLKFSCKNSLFSRNVTGCQPVSYGSCLEEKSCCRENVKCKRHASSPLCSPPNTKDKYLCIPNSTE